MDVALDGPRCQQAADREQRLPRGEGYCGSGVQVFALHDAEWRAKARDAGVAVLYIHALNPYGFSHIRRATHENVDLNRNFHDFSRSRCRNEPTANCTPAAARRVWPPDAANVAAIDQLHRHARRGGLARPPSRGAA
jgi:hypothetical protein